MGVLGPESPAPGGPSWVGPRGSQGLKVGGAGRPEMGEPDMASAAELVVSSYQGHVLRISEA